MKAFARMRSMHMNIHANIYMHMHIYVYVCRYISIGIKGYALCRWPRSTLIRRQVIVVAIDAVVAPPAPSNLDP